MEYNLLDGAQLILYSKEEVFLVRRHDIPIWQITGGGIEKHEDPKQAAIREAIEETGFEVEVIRYLGTVGFKNIWGKIYKSQYVYEGRVLSGTFKPEFPGCLGQWFLVKKLPFTACSYTKYLIKLLNKGIKHPFDKTIYHFGRFSELHIFLLHPIISLSFILRLFGRKFLFLSKPNHLE